MIEKKQVTTTMLDGRSARTRVTLPWDSERQREVNSGKYVREKSDAPYNTSRWHKLARAFLDSHPLCEECKRNGIVKAAQCVDHIDPWPICESYFFDKRNLQALCFNCNNLKGQRDKARIREWRQKQGK